MDLGNHAGFILASYAAVTIVVAALIVWLVVDGRRQQRALDEIENETGRRRDTRE